MVTSIASATMKCAHPMNGIRNRCVHMYYQYYWQSENFTHAEYGKAQLKVGSTILSIILATDKTHLTNFSGDKSMHAVYMSLGNIHKDAQHKLKNHAWLLVAKTPVTKFPCTQFDGLKTEKKAMPGILHQQLFHKCMKILLSPTSLECHQYCIIPGPDGLFHLTMMIMMAWIVHQETLPKAPRSSESSESS